MVAPLQVAIDDRSLSRALSDDYPYSEAQDIFELVLQPGKAPEPHRTAARAWRFADESRTWFVTLAPDSITLHTTAYESRTDFLNRTSTLLHRICEHVKLPSLSRLGFRYTNRAEGSDNIREIVRHLAPGAQGLLSVVKDTDPIAHIMSEVSYRWASDYAVLAKWGLLPPGATLDAAMPATTAPSWVLDIDVYHEATLEFDVELVIEELMQLSKRAYRFFRWAVLPEGLKQFGAE